jgi:hypothetical protein
VKCSKRKSMASVKDFVFCSQAEEDKGVSSRFEVRWAKEISDHVTLAIERIETSV